MPIRAATLFTGLAALLLTACLSWDLTPSSEADGDCTDSLAVGFAADPTVGTAPLTVSFGVRVSQQDLDCGDITFRWGWDGLRYTTTEEADVAYTYSQPGTYAVTVTAMTEYHSVTSQTILIRVRGEFTPIRQGEPLLLSVSTREFDQPVTTFAAASAITAEAMLDNPYDFEVGCRIGYRWGPKATFRLYDHGVEVARSGTGIVVWVEDSVAFPPGVTITASSTVDSWDTPSGSTFTPYPGVFTIAAVPAFQCWAPVESSPATIVITP